MNNFLHLRHPQPEPDKFDGLSIGTVLMASGFIVVIFGLITAVAVRGWI